MTFQCLKTLKCEWISTILLIRQKKKRKKISQNSPNGEVLWSKYCFTNVFSVGHYLGHGYFLYPLNVKNMQNKRRNGKYFFTALHVCSCEFWFDFLWVLTAKLHGNKSWLSLRQWWQLEVNLSSLRRRQLSEALLKGRDLCMERDRQTQTGWERVWHVSVTMCLRATSSVLFTQRLWWSKHMKVRQTFPLSFEQFVYSQPKQRGSDEHKTKPARWHDELHFSPSI